MAANRVGNHRDQPQQSRQCRSRRTRLNAQLVLQVYLHRQRRAEDKQDSLKPRDHVSRYRSQVSNLVTKAVLARKQEKAVQVSLRQRGSNNHSLSVLHMESSCLHLRPLPVLSYLQAHKVRLIHLRDQRHQ